MVFHDSYYFLVVDSKCFRLKRNLPMIEHFELAIEKFENLEISLFSFMFTVNAEIMNYEAKKYLLLVLEAKINNI